MSKAVHMQKLDIMITSQSALSTETLLSQERRKILMKFVVDQDKLHDFEMESLTTDDQKASKKLANLHQPMMESKGRSKSSKNILTTSEIDSIAASMTKKRSIKDLSRPLPMPDAELPRANLERRSTRMNGRSLGINTGDSSSRNLTPGIANFQKLANFNIVDLINKKNAQRAEVKKHAQVQDVVSLLISSEKQILQKQMSLPDRATSPLHDGLGPLNEVLPAEVMQMLPSQVMLMMERQSNGLYKFKQPLAMGEASVIEEDGEEEENDDGEEQEQEQEQESNAPPSVSVSDSSVSVSSVSINTNTNTSAKKQTGTGAVCFSPIKLRTRVSPNKSKKRLGFMSEDDDVPKGRSMILRPIGCHFHQ